MAGRGRGIEMKLLVASTVATGRGLPASIGAGCGLACRNSALMQIAAVAVVAMPMPSESQGRRHTVRHNAAPMPKSALPTRDRPVTTTERSRSNIRSSITAADAAVRSLGTFSHLAVRLMHGDFAARLSLGFHVADVRSFPVDGQANRYAGPLAHAAANLDRAGVKRHQAVHDGQSQPGAVVRPRVRAARLEKRIADPRQIGRVNPDSGVFHHQYDVRPFQLYADRHASAPVRELDGIGQEVEQDLLDGAFVGSDF